jgi:hypothetical protein
MNKLMSIFGAIVFASFIMTSCSGASPEASPEASTGGGGGTTEVKAGDKATAEVVANDKATAETVAPAAPVSANANGTSEAN